MIPVSQPLLDGRENDYLAECIASGWVSSDGPFVEKFEESFASYINVRHGITVSNGTAALEAAFFAVGLETGDEVIMPSFTIISCAIAVMRFGAKPILVDIESDTWNIDTKLIETKITSRTKAILAVHMYGHPCDLDPILNLARRYKLKVIEDASQVHGATYKGKMCGSIGDISTFSFYANKIITTGEGGMVMTSNDALAERVRSYRNLCFRTERRFLHTEVGNNLRMSNLQAALGLAQLERIDQFIKTKRENGARYLSGLSGIKGIKTQVEMSWAQMVFWMYSIELEEETGLDAKKVMETLGKVGVGTRPFFLGLHEQPVLRNKGWYSNEEFPVTERASRQGLYLPSSLNLTINEIEYVILQLGHLLKKN